MTKSYFVRALYLLCCFVSSLVHASITNPPNSEEYELLEQLPYSYEGKTYLNRIIYFDANQRWVVRDWGIDDNGLTVFTGGFCGTFPGFCIGISSDGNDRWRELENSQWQDRLGIGIFNPNFRIIDSVLSSTQTLTMFPNSNDPNSYGVRPGYQLGSIKAGDIIVEPKQHFVLINFTSPAITFSGNLSQTPQSGVPGTEFVRSGMGLSINQTYRMVTVGPDEFTGLEETITTDSQGEFQTSFASNINDPDGTYRWWLIEQKGGSDSGTIGYTLGVGGTHINLQSGVSAELLPPFQIPLGFGLLQSENYFDPNKETYVIVHGMNTAPLKTDRQDWMDSLGDAIHDGNYSDQPNILYWNWMKEAKIKLVDEDPDDIADSCGIGLYLPGENPGEKIELLVPYSKTHSSGIFLAQALNRAIDEQYNKPIHLLGHSLGSLVVTYASEYAFENGWKIGDLINHLVFFDSPCFSGQPANDYLTTRQNHDVDGESNLFVENYLSAFGRPFKSGADSNISLLDSLPSISKLIKHHSYPQKWYQSSTKNFQDSSILNNSSMPSENLPWGSYWSDPENRLDLSKSYSQRRGQPEYSLIEGALITDPTAAAVFGLVGLIDDIGPDTLERLRERVEASAQTFRVLKAITFPLASSITELRTDTVGHAFYSNKTLIVKHASTALLEIPIEIPVNSDFLTLSLNMTSGGHNSVVEIFLDNELIHFKSGFEMLHDDKTLIPLLDVKKHSGKNVNLTFRWSNPSDDIEGEIVIDDIILGTVEISSTDEDMCVPIKTSSGKIALICL